MKHFFSFLYLKILFEYNQAKLHFLQKWWVYKVLEIYQMFRYKLPVVTVILNNSGIYRGMTPEDMKSVDGDPTLM